MINFENSEASKEIINFRCPRYEELPDIDLYMEQLIEVLNNHLNVFLTPNEEKMITSTMVNNYVKQRIIEPPLNKKYSKQQLVYLFVIGILKQVLSLPDASKLFEMQNELYPVNIAYNFFCTELEKSLHSTFVTRDFSGESSATNATPASEITRSALISFANKIYTKKYLLYNEAI